MTICKPRVVAPIASSSSGSGTVANPGICHLSLRKSGYYVLPEYLWVTLLIPPSRTLASLIVSRRYSNSLHTGRMQMVHGSPAVLVLSSVHAVATAFAFVANLVKVSEFRHLHITYMATPRNSEQ
jgi:hypothetical protein